MNIHQLRCNLPVVRDHAESMPTLVVKGATLQPMQCIELCPAFTYCSKGWSPCKRNDIVAIITTAVAATKNWLPVLSPHKQGEQTTQSK